VIRLRDVWRTYRVGDEELHALAGVDLDVRAGEHLAIMGPSGSGKSTLLNLIGCLDRPTRGSYELAGRDVGKLDERALSRVRQELIGYVFQAYHLIERLDAAGNVELPLVFAGIAPAERKRRVAEALESVGLTPRAGHRPSALSGGQRQRVAIARATVLWPRVLLADEPTGNLDRAAGGRVLDMLDELNAGGLTLLTVTHDPEVARRAERVIVLEDGRIARTLRGDEIEDPLAHLRGRVDGDEA
jgi:putative ABC transport system ATP-binding protein